MTIHKLEKEFDTGDILLQQSFAIKERENLETMTETIRRLIPGMMEELVSNFWRLYYHAAPQGRGSYYPCPQEADWTIGPETEAFQADRILRAFYGFPCIYEDKGRRLELVKGSMGQPGPDSLPVRGGWVRAEEVRELPVL